MGVRDNVKIQGDSVYHWVCRAMIDKLLQKNNTIHDSQTCFLGVRLTELTACWSSSAECKMTTNTPTTLLWWPFCTSLCRHEPNCRL